MQGGEGAGVAPVSSIPPPPSFPVLILVMGRIIATESTSGVLLTIRQVLVCEDHANSSADCVLVWLVSNFQENLILGGSRKLQTFNSEQKARQIIIIGRVCWPFRLLQHPGRQKNVPAAAEEKGEVLF